MTTHDQRFQTSSELTLLGFSPNDIRAEVKSGRLRRIRRGLYAAEDIPDPEEQHRRLVRAALTAVNDTTVISHVSAGVLHGLPVPRSDYDRVSVIRRSPGHGRHGEHLVIRRTRLDADEIMLLDGVPVTTPARTVADLARTSPFEWGLMAADAALHLGLASPPQLSDAVHRRPRLLGARLARRVVGHADGLAESAAESLSRATMLATGIPMPRLQAELFDEAGQFIARTDFLWEELRLVGEVSGKHKYQELLRPGQTAADVVMQERRRDEGLRQLGYWPVHWDYAIAGDHQALPALIRRGMELQARRLGL